MTNMTRITGMATGMDTDTMIQNMMKAEKLKVSAFEQKKIRAGWKQEDYNAINKDLANFIINSKKELGLGKLSGGTFFSIPHTKLDYVKKATLSNETVATATATAKTMNGSFRMKVKELAEGADLHAKVSANGTLGKDVRMKLKVDGKEHEVYLNNADGSDVTYDQLVEKLNSKDWGVQASFAKDDNGTGVLSIRTKSVGADSKLEISDLTTTNAALNAMPKQATGKNAKVDFNGVEMEFKSNEIELNGVHLALKSTSTEEVKVSVSNNVDEMVKRVTKFVDDYNELLDKLSKKTSEKVYSEATPLTAEEKKSLNETEVKEWTEKAKSGLLKDDELLRRIMSNSRLDVYKSFEGDKETSLKHITDIGISTVRYQKGAAGGKLQVDEAKLREVLSKDPESVMDLLFSEGKKDVAGKVKTETQGVFNRIYSGLESGIKEIVRQAGPGKDASLLRQVNPSILMDFVTKGGKKGIGGVSDLDGEMLDYTKRMDDLNRILERKEDDLYKKFARLETMIQKMQSQSSWIGGQMGGR